MEKSNKICKYQLETSIKPILIYYSILIGVLLLVLIQKVLCIHIAIFSQMV